MYLIKFVLMEGKTICRSCLG